MTTTKRKKNTIVGTAKAIRTKLVIKTEGKNIPVFKLPLQKVIDASRFIPVFDLSIKTKKDCLVVRIEDIVKGPSGNNQTYLALQGGFGHNSIDKFTPLYGYRFLGGNQNFYFVESCLMTTFISSWQFGRSDYFDFNQYLSFGFSLLPGVTANLMSIKFGQINDAASTGPAILTVAIGDAIQNIDVTSYSNRTLDIFFNAGVSTANISLIFNKTLNNKRQLLSIASIELFNALLLQPPGLDNLRNQLNQL